MNEHKSFVIVCLFDKLTVIHLQTIAFSYIPPNISLNNYSTITGSMSNFLIAFLTVKKFFKKIKKGIDKVTCV